MAGPVAPGLEPELRRLARRLLGREVGAVLLVNSWRGDFSAVAGLVFAAGGATPELAFKAATCPEVAPCIETEHANLSRLDGRLAAPFARSVPRPLAFERAGRFTLLFESVLKGRPLSACPPPAGAELGRLLDAVADWLVAFHGAAGEPLVPLEGERFEALVLEPFERYLRSFAVGAVERSFLEAAAHEAAGLEGARLQVVPQHGDFCAANVLTGGESPIEVIDWEEPFRPSLPLMDFFHFVSSAGLTDRRALERDGLALFAAVFLEEGPLRAAVRRALRRAGAALGLEPEQLRSLAVRYWVAYALEKLDALKGLPGSVREAGPRSGAPSDPASGVLNAFTSARFAGGTCLNLKLMAQRSADFRAFV